VNSYKSFLLASTVITVLSTMGSAAFADDSTQVETVTVTALRVSGTLQNTPASVSVVSSQDIIDAGVQDLSDVSALVPNVQFDNGWRAGVPQISLRGIPTVQGGEAPAAFVVDGVQVPSLDFINQDLLDIADVQVLRGPQGAIYGRDAIGGAVLIDTQRPTNEFQDNLTLDYGNGDFFRAVNTMSGALVDDRLWAKLTLEDRDFSGLIQDVGLGKPGDWSKEVAGRAEIVAKPTSTTTVDLTYSHTQAIDGASYYEFVFGYNVGDFKADVPDRNLDTNDHRYINTYSAKVDQVTPIGTLTSVTQYADTDSEVVGDADWTPAPVVQQWNAVGVKAFNEDLRLASPTNQTVQWFVGGFYQLRQTTNNLNVFFEPNPGGNIYCGCAGGPSFSVEQDNDHNNSLAWAVYGQAIAALPDDFKLLAALRYDTDKRFDQDLSIPPGPTNAISATFQALQPSATLSKQFDPDFLGYVTVGRGFRSGGFNAYTDSVASGLLVPREYPEETDLNYEGGIKSQFLNNRLTVNADVFHTDFSNEQYFLVNASPPSRDIVTIKSVSFNGGELEITYLPVDGLTLGGSLGVAASNINSNDIDQNDQNKQSPEANLYTANISAEYRQPLWSDYDALYRVDYSYKGPICYDSANDYCYHSVGFLDARVGIENGRYTFAVWGKNILSVREPLSFLPNTFGPGVSLQLDNEPATYGVEVLAHF